MWGLLVTALVAAPLTAATAQVRAGAEPAARAAGGAPSIGIKTAVTTAPVRGLVEVNVPEGATVMISQFYKPGSGPSGDYSEFTREVRDGAPVLIRTDFAKAKDKYGFPYYKALGQEVFPSATRVLRAGPWQMNTKLQKRAHYALIPLDQDMPRRTSPPKLSRRIESVGRSMSQAISGSAPSAPPKLVLAATASPNCGVSINPQALGEPAEADGLECLELASGQGTMLPGGLLLFQRWESHVEVWRDDVREHVGVRVLRDRDGRHWLLDKT